MRRPVSPTGGVGTIHARQIRLPLENGPEGAAFTQRVRGVGEGRVFCYATLPQLLSYTLYLWENNIRAAAMLCVVGAGGLGQILAFYMGLFQMSETGAILLVMIALVALIEPDKPA